MPLGIMRCRPRLHEKVDEVSPQGGCNIRKAPKRQRLSNAFYGAEGALKSYETAFVPVTQMGGALSNAFFRRKYLFSVEESYQKDKRAVICHFYRGHSLSVLRSPAYLPTVSHARGHGRASAEFSILSSPRYPVK